MKRICMRREIEKFEEKLLWEYLVESKSIREACKMVNLNMTSMLRRMEKYKWNNRIINAERERRALQKTTAARTERDEFVDLFI